MTGPQLGDEEDHVDGGANGITVKQSCEANRNLVAFDDLVAAHHLVSMFAVVGLVPPKIAFDDDTWRDVYEHGLEAYDVYIAIGLFSNCVTTTLNARWEKADQRCFAMSTRQEVIMG
jgi:hypothetical protein